MDCNTLPHTVEQIQEFLRKQAEIDDTARQEAIVEVINKFELAKALKQQLRTQYHECNHMSDDRKFVITDFLYSEFRKDHAVVEKLRSCVSQIHAQKANKIRWSHEENVQAAMVEQQQQTGASGSSAPRGVDDSGWNSDKERELSRMEAELEAERLASFDPYDDGYDSNNSQTWDHPDYN